MNIYLIILILLFVVYLLSRIIKFIFESKRGIYAIITDKDSFIDTGYYETRIDMRLVKKRTKFVIYTKNNYYYVSYDLYVSLNIGDKIFIKGSSIQKV